MDFPWKAEGAVDRLTTMWVKERMSARAIAAVLSVEFGHPLGRNHVIGKVHRLGLSGKGGASMPARSPQAFVELPAATPAPPPAPPALAPRPPTVPAPAVAAAASAVTAPLPRSPLVPPADGLPLQDLPPFGCRFAVTDHMTRNHRFCGKRSVTGKPWCAEHIVVVFDYTPRSRRVVAGRGA